MTHIVIMVVLLVIAIVVVVIDLRRGKAKEQRLLASPPEPPVEEVVLDRPRSAIVVDDNPVMRLTIRRVLEQQAYEVAEARDGHEALARLGELTTSRPATVVVVDSESNEMGGVDLVRSLRADPAQDGIRIVLMTPDADADRLAAAFDGDGAVQYLRKPFTSDALLTALRSSE